MTFERRETNRPPCRIVITDVRARTRRQTFADARWAFEVFDVDDVCVDYSFASSWFFAWRMARSSWRHQKRKARVS